MIEHIIKFLFDDVLMNDLTDTLVEFQKRKYHITNVEATVN